MALKRKTKSSKKGKLLSLEVRAIRDKQTKSDIIRTIAESTELSNKQVRAVLEQVGYLARCHLTAKGSGEFTVPELAVKIMRKTRPATKRREGRNPFTGETVMIAAKPKRNIVRVKALKSLKEIVAS